MANANINYEVGLRVTHIVEKLPSAPGVVNDTRQVSLNVGIVSVSTSAASPCFNQMVEVAARNCLETQFDGHLISDIGSSPISRVASCGGAALFLASNTKKGVKMVPMSTATVGVADDTDVCRLILIGKGAQIKWR